VTADHAGWRGHIAPAGPQTIPVRHRVPCPAPQMPAPDQPAADCRYRPLP